MGFQGDCIGSTTMEGFSVTCGHFLHSKTEGRCLLWGAQCAVSACGKYRAVCTCSKSLFSLRVDFARVQSRGLGSEPGGGGNGNRHQVRGQTGKEQSPRSHGGQSVTVALPNPSSPSQLREVCRLPEGPPDKPGGLGRTMRLPGIPSLHTHTLGGEMLSFTPLTTMLVCMPAVISLDLPILPTQNNYPHSTARNSETQEPHPHQGCSF